MRIPRRLVLTATCALFSGVALAASASQDTLALLQKQLQQQQELIEKQQKLLQRQQERLQAQNSEFKVVKRRLDALDGMKGVPAPVTTTTDGKPARLAAAETKIPPMPNDKASSAPADTPVPAGGIAAARDGATKTANQEVGTDRRPVANGKISEITVIDDNTGVLLQKGKLILEPGLEYSNSSATRVDVEGFAIIPALTIGSIDVSQVNRDSVTSRLTGRLGVTNRLEVDATVPYLYRDDRTQARPVGTGSSSDTLTEVSGNGLGDIEFGAHYQLNEGKENSPIFIGNAHYKSDTGRSPFDVDIDPNTGLERELPTGSGFQAFSPSVTAIFPNDPVVFFGNLGYVFNFEKDQGSFGKVNPGDAINASVGASLAVNDKTSLSFSYAHETVFDTEINGQSMANSGILQIGTLNIGGAYRLNDRVSLNLLVGAGVTEDAPDARILFKVPISFSAF